MAGLVPAIHVFDSQGEQDVDARDTSAFTRVFRRAKRGHDGAIDAAGSIVRRTIFPLFTRS